MDTVSARLGSFKASSSAHLSTNHRRHFLEHIREPQMAIKMEDRVWKLPDLCILQLRRKQAGSWITIPSSLVRKCCQVKANGCGNWRQASNTIATDERKVLEDEVMGSKKSKRQIYTSEYSTEITWIAEQD
ncbi:hypothetical protein SERLADRAFT_436271 [Serpula lacrymans var. lacrymans S7.9]|uniref:Uncharacterized protein n=1 Tax=Serpula lacrymans var. lacrymans (strain S7.9) TaxID=578457 RepID=F8NSK5_SERL9|nr:uncharacterized protein SERLADRAFT_436271 [Serpula lacrymans var. lacrymans S7.9]EGO26460.1 hypothetical protein SERLADRAFT_436271 [Serpula lacrymans var. lacrymans S7.9]